MENKVGDIQETMKWLILKSLYLFFEHRYYK